MYFFKPNTINRSVLCVYWCAFVCLFVCSIVCSININSVFRFLLRTFLNVDVEIVAHRCKIEEICESQYNQLTIQGFQIWSQRGPFWPSCLHKYDVCHKNMTYVIKVYHHSTVRLDLLSLAHYQEKMSGLCPNVARLPLDLKVLKINLTKSQNCPLWHRFT